MARRPGSDSPIRFLLDRFAESREKPAFIFRGKPFTYGCALERIEAWQARARKDSISQGSVVAVTGDFCPDTCCLLLALAHLRAVAVPFASVTGAEKDALADIAETQFEYLFEAGKFRGLKKRKRRISNPLLASLVAARAPGLVVFSSGSTGKPKGILHDFSRLLEKFKVPRKTLRALTFLRLDHLGGINTLLYILSNGGVVVSIEDRSPAAVGEAVERHRIELLPVTPSFLNLFILSGEIGRRDLSSLKVISYGTEVMPQATLDKVRALLPQVELQQTYGLSELGVLRTKSRPDGSLWVKVGGEGFETKVVDGILWIRSKAAMLGYLNAPQPFDGEGWFNTEDQVEVDGDYIRIQGRRSEAINVGGQKVFPSEVEEILLQAPNVRDAVVRGEKHFLMGHIVAARINLVSDEDPEQSKTRIRDFCKARLSSYKIPAKIEISREELFGPRFKRLRGGP